MFCTFCFLLFLICDAHASLVMESTLGNSPRCRIASGGVTFDFYVVGGSSFSYEVERSSDLRSWVGFGPVVYSSAGWQSVFFPSASRQFFRLRVRRLEDWASLEEGLETFSSFLVIFVSGSFGLVLLRPFRLL